MTKAEITALLQAEINKTTANIQAYLEETKPVEPDCAIDQASRMETINHQAIVSAALRQAQEKLTALNKIMESVNDANFGHCLKCHQPIPIQRIIIRPQSLLCAQCAR